MGINKKAGTPSTEHKSEDVTDQSCVAGTSARRVDECASGSAELDGSCGVSAFARKSWPSACCCTDLSDPTGGSAVVSNIARPERGLSLQTSLASDHVQTSAARRRAIVHAVRVLSVRHIWTASSEQWDIWRCRAGLAGPKRPPRLHRAHLVAEFQGYSNSTIPSYCTLRTKGTNRFSTLTRSCISATLNRSLSHTYP
jgi:hypothetical protein